MIYNQFCKKYFPLKWVVLIVYYIWYKTFIESYYFLCVYEDYRTDLSKHVSINMQICRNCLYKCSKYTIL